jgi:uncharacterized protein (TIGR03000 family)
MNYVRLVIVGLLILGSQGTASHRLHAASIQATAPAATQLSSRVKVTVPHEQTELVVEGKPIPGEGTVREFVTAPLEKGKAYRYVFTAKWQPNTYTTITRNKTVSFRGGDAIAVDLTVDDPNDRARVIYVPTPADVADEMVRLAGVTGADVAFEPGCGDARITIAAVKGGARRAVGIDIDPERVSDSRARVKEAGLADRIEIREGDALDIKDLSSASVVFLYMGDHFNLLIRPILWRELKVGARVVSHRFKMGDWEPAKTISVASSEGGEYELHLWTITEDVKRRMERQ